MHFSHSKSNISKLGILFYILLSLFVILEVLIDYLLMPVPGSQELDSLSLTYFLFQRKLLFEIFLLIPILFSATILIRNKYKWMPLFSILMAASIYIFTNFIFTAEHRFQQPKNLIFESAKENEVDLNKMAILVEKNGKAKAYTVEFVEYHHQIRDSVGGQAILATYCPACQTGRFYLPYIKGVYTKFRLVGMNNRNAMLEDETTHSWWSQETGICIAGKLLGESLTLINTRRFTINKCIELYPDVQIMQADPAFKDIYFSNDYYAKNTSSSDNLVRIKDWTPRTFILGIRSEHLAKAYDWHYLLRKRIINDSIGTKKILLVVSNDNRSAAAFENHSSQLAKISQDTIFIENVPYDFTGLNLKSRKKELTHINVYREYWFSWKYANPNTSQHDCF